jgi:thiol-disulfide isomerase/thioredoxin
MTVAEALKKWDFYKKIPSDLTESTLPGISLSMCGTVVMVLLFILEFNAYLTVQTSTDIVLDEGNDEMLTINFNVTIADLPCRFASVDVVDMTGTKRHNVTRNVDKWRLDHAGRNLGYYEHKEIEIEELTEPEDPSMMDSEAESHLMDSHEGFEGFLDTHHLVAVNFHAPWCIWCQRLEPVWTRTAKTLPSLHYGQRVRLAHVDCTESAELCHEHHIRAYPTIVIYKNNHEHQEFYDGDRSVDGFLNRLKGIIDGEHNEGDMLKKMHHDEDKKKAASEGKNHKKRAGPEGCMVAGLLKVKKVPGNFHVTLFDKKFSQNHDLINATHYIDNLWFGEPLNYQMFSSLPKSVQAEVAAQRLEGKAFVATRKNHTYVHYLKLVTSTYKRPGRKDIHLYKYSAHSNEYMEIDDVPSVMIRYDLSPMSVVVTEEFKPFYHFVTNACAIIGGVFTVIGLVDSIVHQVVTSLNKKVL